MRTLLLGSGGRESALAWALDRSKTVDELIVSPGNPGIAAFAHLESCDIEDPTAVTELAKRVGAGLVVVGPEAPLVTGVADALRAEGVAVFGPDAAAARIEGSKAHAKTLMERAGIPTAAWRSFTEPDAAISFMDELGPPYVIKADGLAAGKGVVVTEDRDAAVRAVTERLVERTFGDAGTTVVIEEFLDGEETSLIAFSDGSSVVPCEPAQDYKRARDSDRGPNTGGMGSYSPVPACPPETADQIVDEVIRPMVEQSAVEGAPFVGALYAGLALTGKGVKVVEFNARFGDPETQALIPRLDSDLGEVAMAAATGQLAGIALGWSSDVCVSVVLASGGYPGKHRIGLEIDGLDSAAAVDGVVLFHAGTRAESGRIVTSGGRVLAVSATAPTFAEARGRAYDAAGHIDFEGKHTRSDIALRAENLEGRPV
ncbi:MAG TPA: phosphoribosylamine--glycine ligase [Actinomycetota bacterium]|nr:phosphoribosylamine--glycine ligase [Actinomycetota bacterium]